ncbi:MAG: choice-of-anchor R domain-containing protein [Dehalococcoidia bacterium]|jgi:hypothetical protein
MSTLYEYYDSLSFSTSVIYGGHWIGQTFTPQISHKITSVKLLLSKSGSPGTLTVGIYATAGGVPTGSVLCSGTTNGNTLTEEGYDWREITLGSGANLTQGTTYAIVFHLGGDASNFVYFVSEDPDATYPRGTLIDSGDSGASWTPSATSGDALFEDWGVIIETAYNTPVGTKASWGLSLCDYEGAEACPVGNKNAWAWAVPTYSGGNQTKQGTKNDWAWGSE